MKLQRMVEIEWIQSKKQKKAWDLLQDKTTNEIVFGGGAGGAKSFLGCGWLIVMCVNYPRTRWLMGRNKLKRLKETTLKTFFEVCRMWGIKEGVHFIYNASDGVIKFKNGSEILLKDLAYQPSDPNFDDLGSLELTGAFIDEVNQITHKCWQIINTRIRYKLDEYDLIPKCLGTCNPSKGWVYTEFYKPFKNKLQVSGRAFIRALAKNNPFISKHYIEILKRIKDKATRERLLEGNWEYDDDPAILFSFDVVQDLFTNKAKKSKDRFISGDVSRKGRDKMPLGIWQGLKLEEVIVIPDEIRSSTKKSAEFIIKTAQRKNVRLGNIVLDEDGVGGGVVDNIPNCKGFLNNGSPIYTDEEKERMKDNEYFLNYGNLKTQCSFKLAELAEDGKIEIAEEAFKGSDDKDDFIEEIGQIKQKDIDKDGKVYLVGKEKIKENIGRSPDFYDMIMMRMYFEIKTEVEFDIIDVD